MLKHVQIAVNPRRIQLTNGEKAALLGAASLLVGALVQLLNAPAMALSLLLAVVAMCAFVYERIQSRRMLLHVVDRLSADGLLSKAEVDAKVETTVIDQAINHAVQRMRHQIGRRAPHWNALDACHERDESRTVAALSITLRRDLVEHSPTEHVARLIETVQTAFASTPDSAPFLTIQGDGTILLIFGVRVPRRIAASLQQALATAALLGADPYVRFGLGCGSARIVSLPDIDATVIGAPLEDALRLSRMAAAWHEHTLLCVEPVALLAHTNHSQRTTLTLTHAALPPLPVYALDLQPRAVARSA